MALADHNANLTFAGKFDEASDSDNALDSSSANNPLTQNNTPSVGSSGWPSGLSGYRGCVSGNSEYFESLAVKTDETKPWSFASWFRMHSASWGTWYPWNSYTNSSSTFRLRLNGAGFLTLYVYTSSGNANAGVDVGTADADWHLAQFTIDPVGEQIRVNIDDVGWVTTSNSMFASINDDSTPFRIARRGGAYYSMDISLTCIWEDVILSDTEFSDFYNSGDGTESFLGSLSQVGIDRVIRMDDWAVVGSDRVGSFDSKAIVGASRSSEFNNLGVSGSNRQSLFNVLDSVGASRQGEFNVQSIIGSDRVARFDGFELVGIDRVSQFDNLSSLGSVGINRAFRFKNRSVVRADRASRFDTLQTLGLSRDTQFDNLIVVGVDRINEFDAAQVVGVIRDIRSNTQSNIEAFIVKRSLSSGLSVSTQGLGVSASKGVGSITMNS